MKSPEVPLQFLNGPGFTSSVGESVVDQTCSWLEKEGSIGLPSQSQAELELFAFGAADDAFVEQPCVNTFLFSERHVAAIGDIDLRADCAVETAGTRPPTGELQDSFRVFCDFCPMIDDAACDADNIWVLVVPDMLADELPVLGFGVVIGKENDISFGRPDPHIPRVGQTRLVDVDVTHSVRHKTGEIGFETFFDDRGLVDDDDFKIGVGLCEKLADRICDDIVSVVCRDDQGQKRIEAGAWRFGCGKAHMIILELR